MPGPRARPPPGRRRGHRAPCSSSQPARRTAGDERMSSVPALKASPRSPIRRPATPPTISSIRSANRSWWARLARCAAEVTCISSPRSIPDDGDRLELLGQAAAAEPEARVQIGRADPRVEPDPFEHRPDVGPGVLGQAGHLVGERDLEREECVGAVLDQLGLLERDQPERPAERPEDLDQDGLGLRIRVRGASDDDAGRLGEVGAAPIPGAGTRGR